MCKILYNIITEKTVTAPSIKIAEMSKLLENIYRSINIALINELKIATRKLDLDLYKVIEIAETKPFGFQNFFQVQAQEAIAFLLIRYISHGFQKRVLM